MKKFHAFVCALMCVPVVACMHQDGNINITYSNSDHYYSMEANFSESKMPDVEAYLNKKIGNRSNMSFTNTRIDGTISLYDKTSFYIQKSPGLLNIKLDKDANSDEAFERIKTICEGIKSIVIKPS